MAIQTLNVSQLKCACMDPEWRKRWLAGKNPPTQSFSNGGNAPVHGTIFHKIVEKFTHWLTHTKRIPLGLHDEAGLWNEMYSRFAEKQLLKLVESNQNESACHLSECLRIYCHRLTELHSRTSDFQSWQDIYLTQEFSVKDVKIRVGNSFIFISGKIDAVRTHPEYGIEIVDYKLSHGVHLEHDLLQIAIYAKLLEIEKKLKPHGVLEYYEPQLHEITASANQLDDIFQELVVPVLYELTSEPLPASNNKPSVSPQIKSEPLKDIASSLSEQIQQCFKSFKLDVEIVGSHEAPQVIRYKVKPGAGVKVISLVNRSEDLQVALSLKQPPIIEPAQGFVTIDIPKETPDTVFWKDLIKKPECVNHVSTVSFPVGVAIDNQVIIADFADPNMCHALIAGSSGSGKSEFLKSMAASLISKNLPETLTLSIIDPKILTFGGLADCPYLNSPVITDSSSAITCLQKAVEEMEARYRLLGAEGVENLARRFESGKNDIPFHIIIIDEFAELVLVGKDEKKEFETLVSRLAAKGRAAGIHLVLSTQRPDSKIVTGLIKANLPLKICMRVNSESNSRIILDQGGGQALLGKGDLLCDRGRGIERAQSPFIPSETLSELISNRIKHCRLG